MEQSTKKIKLILIFLLLVVLVYPFIRDTNFSKFLSHPIERTDLDWKKNAVDCMKANLPEADVFGLKVIGNVDLAAITRAEFQLQYNFAPIILDIYDPWKHDFTIIYLFDSGILLTNEINGRQVKAVCDEKLMLVEK